MWAVTGLFILGLFMLVLGGASFAEHASALSAKLRIPPFLIGATAAAVGTTLPELVLSAKAAVSGCGEISSASALGAVVCCSCLVGGLCILISPASGLRRKDIVKGFFFFLLAACFISLSARQTGVLGTGLGIILLCILSVYAATNSSRAGYGRPSQEDERPELSCVGMIVAGAALYLGSGLIIDNCLLLAETLGLEQKTVALTFVAFGASLPELFTALSSLRKKQPAIALGTVIGANILKLLLAIGLPAVIVPIQPGREIYRELSAASAAMCALVLPPAFTGRTYRWQGAVLLAIYAVFVVLCFI